MPATAKHPRMYGDLLFPMNVLVNPGGEPLDLSAYTTYIVAEQEDGTAAIALTVTGITAHPTQTFTAASTGLATCNRHGVKHGQQVVVASTSTLPSGLSSSTRYFAVQVTQNAFGLATLPDGVSVIAGAGSGTHTFYVVGSLQYTFQSALAVGLYRAWIHLLSGSAFQKFPNDEYGIPIEIKAMGN